MASTPSQNPIVGVFYAVHNYGPIRLEEITKVSGLVEIHAQQALKTLMDQRFIAKGKEGYLRTFS